MPNHPTAFLRGFADATGQNMFDAGDAWSWYARQLSDRELARIEAGGRRAGEREGRRFMRDYPEFEYESELLAEEGGM